MIGKSNMEDDSVLLKQRSDEKRKLSWQVFKEYYLIKTILGVVIGGFLLWQVISIAFFNTKPALQVMTIGTAIPLECQELFIEKATADLGIDEKKEFVSITPGFNREMLMPLIATGGIDVFLMDKASFEEVLAEGFLLKLPDIEGLPDERICFGQSEEDMGKHPYGVLVTDSSWLESLGLTSMDEVIFGVAANSEHLEMSEKFFWLIK